LCACACVCVCACARVCKLRLCLCVFHVCHRYARQLADYERLVDAHRHAALSEAAASAVADKTGLVTAAVGAALENAQLLPATVAAAAAAAGLPPLPPAPPPPPSASAPAAGEGVAGKEATLGRRGLLALARGQLAFELDEVAFQRLALRRLGIVDPWDPRCVLIKPAS